jgi:tyrosine-protein kinase Etk/Wzc
MSNATSEIRIDVLDSIMVLSQWKKTILFTTLLFVGTALVLALTMHPQYIATTVVIPKEDNMDVVSSFIKNMPMAKSQLKGNIFSPATDIENVYLAVLKSRKLQLDVIHTFDLAEVYKFKKGRYFIEDVLTVFNKHVKSYISDEGMLFVKVEDERPKRAADIANYITSVMDNIYGNLAVETARNRRIFLEDRLRIIKKDLRNCEDSLTHFQVVNRIVDVEQQAKATIDAGAMVEAKLLATELELNIAKKTFTPDNQKIKEMETNLAEMKKQREALTDVRESSLLLPLKIAPQVGIEFVRLKRNLKVQELAFEFIMQQYEAAKFEEAKNTPHVQILDRADPPEKRSKPKRKRMVAIAFLLSMIFNFIIVNILENVKRMRRNNTENYRKIVMIMKNIAALN